MSDFNISDLPTRRVRKAIALSTQLRRLSNDPDKAKAKRKELEAYLDRAYSELKTRMENQPKIKLSGQLPIHSKVDEIQKLLASRQVLVLGGETGSGKTTQLPQICIDAGLGNRGQIAHTQPRRVAATSVASRIADEMKVNLGDQVGVSVRFYERSSDVGYLKLMTDGMLLAEIQQDPLLTRYQVVIIDEAHERSINIDFLLGLIKQVLSKRRDLKLIITSATIDLQRFSAFFDNAPIVKVEGRTYPVDIQYRPIDPKVIDDRDNPELWQISQCIKEAIKQGPGDILIFLPGEGEIRQTAKYLRKLSLSQTTILPLYARLSINEQQKVFKSASSRKIVLSTNVAETSLTVPGIRFVIDLGTARISRFNMRSKIQRLQVEKISQASANQRAGRCGRVSSGVCFRLYAEDDLNNREEFTLPEIKRTNLASVILQMKSMGIKHPEQFPFIDPVEEKLWKDGFNLLFELGALDSKNTLTQLGKHIARWPLDPKLAVMLYKGRQTALNEMLIITSLYSVRDPRERPHDKSQKADLAHEQFNDNKSDFITFINIWNKLHRQQENLSNREFKNYCRENFINFSAWLDWRNTYRQLKRIVNDDGFKTASIVASYEAIHKALLPALLPNILTKTNESYYLGARNSKVFIHPSSVNFKQKSSWLIAGELMDTGKLYARATAPIDAIWIDDAAKHIAKETYLDAHWRKKKGEACAYLQKSLFGLIYISAKLVGYSTIEPKLSRRWLIEKGLLDGEMVTRAPFHAANQKLLSEYRDEETRQRRSDILKSDEELVEFFEQRLPKSIATVKQLDNWIYKRFKDNNRQLSLKEEDVLNPEAELDEEAYPRFFEIRGANLALEYRFEPGHADDGVSFCLPLIMLKQFTKKDFEWLVPGFLQEKIIASIKGLPKSIRKNFIPAPDYANACYERLKDNFGKGDFFQELAECLYQISGKRIDIELWSDLELTQHLQPNFKVFSDGKQPIAKGRDLETLQNKLDSKVKQALKSPSLDKLEPKKSRSQSNNGEHKNTRSELLANLHNNKITSWPKGITFSLEQSLIQGQKKSIVLQAFKDCATHIEVTGCESPFQAECVHRRGVARLILLNLEDKRRYFLRSWHSRKELSKLSILLEPITELIDDACLAVVDSFLPDEPVLSEKDFNMLYSTINKEFNEKTNDTLELILSLLKQTKSISNTVYDKIEPKYLDSYLDIRQQLDELWYSGCLYDHGLCNLKEFSRYFQALEKRLERMSINFPREEQCLREFKLMQNRIKNLAELKHNKEYTLARQDLFYMLQEYRISLFAQGIKTRYPISAKRMEKHMDKMRYLT